MSGTDLHQLTGAYALDALDAEERRAFEEHLATCPSCAVEVRELRATAATLAVASRTEPPESLRSAILSAARATPQDPAATSDARVVQLRARRMSRLLRVAAAGLAAALVGVGSWAVVLHRENATLVAESMGITAVLTSPDASTASGTVDGSGRATVVTSREKAESVFIGSGLPIPENDRTYQLWYIDAGGTARSAGTFVPASDGTVVRQLAGSTPASTTTVGLTIEPAGGSTAPTSPPVLTVRIPA